MIDIDRHAPIASVWLPHPSKITINVLMDEPSYYIVEGLRTPPHFSRKIKNIV